MSQEVNLATNDITRYPSVAENSEVHVTDETNYIIKVQNLVAKILMQLNRISEKDRVQIDALKVKYQKTTADAANYTRNLGRSTFAFSILSLGASFTALSQDQTHRVIGETLTREFCPKLGELFGSKIHSDKYQAESLAQLTLNEYSSKTQKSSSDANSKQEVLNILDKVMESLKRAAQA